MTVSENTRLGRYEIRSQIGKGGMGEVYLAVDTELDRTVAIKILPAEVASDQQRLQRFIQEAKAASALNHPHILTIHEIGTIGDSRYIATEFIEGDTLRRRIAAGMTLEELLEISIQVSSALAAAHSAGIVHRDIKPENVMVRHDGYAKVLDFGLAKLAQPPGVTTDTEAPTKTLVNTDAGTVMGTANYMSPEQARGKTLDARSDLWSVGALLYEMVTKHLPFSGETPNETISLILQKEPAPMMRYANNVPAELERIVTKALTKDPEGRYQTAKDLLIDLRNLKRKLEVDAEIDRTVPPELRGATSTAGGSQAHSTAGNASVPGTTAPSSAEYIVSGIKQHRTAALVGLLVLLLAGGALGVMLYSRRATPSLESIAVLPFVNASGDPNMEYLSDGISETLINSLTRLQRLHVVARATAFRYKGKETDPQTVGRELNVRTVLMGRVRQKGDILNVQVDLVDASTGAQLWGEEFERQATDVLSVKQAISREIIDKLRLRLTGEEQKRLVGSDSNGEAYELYLKGRYYWNKRDEEGLERSVEYFNQAIQKDPNYALAYAGLADSWFTRAWYRVVEPREGYENARAAAYKALSIDENLAEAHTTLGTIKANYDWDWTGGEAELKRAIELNPNYPTAHQRYSLFLPIFGRFDEAIAEAKRAQQLDPLSLILNENVGDIYQLARRFDEAEAQLKKTLELDPNFFVARGTLARLYEAKGMHKEALQQTFAGANPEVMGKVMKLYDEAGIQGVWRVRLADMLKDPEAPPMGVAQLYVKLGDKDKAFEWLNKALDTRGITFTYLVADARFDSIRSDPRYAALLQRANLKPIQLPR